MLLSGGIDSAVALAETVEAGHPCLPVSFLYGQTHFREVASAEAVARHYGLSTHVLDIAAAFRPASALTGAGEIPSRIASDVDDTFVPARNLVLLSLAIGYAEAMSARAVVIGANRDDNDAYPDCRPQFLEAMDQVSRLGTLNYVGVWAPHLYRTKAEVVRRGRDLGVPLHLTWSCYRGGEEPCNDCGACLLREGAMNCTG